MILKENVNKLFLLILVVSLNACNNNLENNVVNNADSTDKDTSTQIKNIQASTEISVQDIDTMPKQIKYEGDIVDAKRWTDKSGEHYVFITEKVQGEYLTESFLSKLNGYMFTKVDTGFTLSWQVRENAIISHEVKYLKKSLTLNDIDNDGEAEAWFFYSLNEDGADPMPLKMILYSRDKKLAIRGIIPRSIADLNMYKKTVDAKAVNKKIEDYASKHWDKVATDEMKRIIGDEVTQDKDFPIKN